jgi:putative intracellular protease/amidase
MIALAFATTMALAPFASHAAETAATPSKGKVLLVASSVNSLVFKDGRSHPTGYFLDELAVPAQEFIKAGYDVVVATPDGNTPALDKNSISESLFQNDKALLDRALSFVLTNPSMQKPKKLGDLVKAGLDQYDALYVPGGHAPMVDLMQDKDLGAALRHFHTANKVTALLCHGPIAVAAAMKDPEGFRRAMVVGDVAKAKSLAAGWPYAGYKMTVYSTVEELPVEKFLGGDIQFYMEDALGAAGAQVNVAAPDKPHVVQDRELITGQNPFSDHVLAEAVIEALNKQVSLKTAGQ